jgi:hypothetical protein
MTTTTRGAAMGMAGKRWNVAAVGIAGISEYHAANR